MKALAVACILFNILVFAAFSTLAEADSQLTRATALVAQCEYRA